MTLLGYIMTFAVGLAHALCGSPLWCPSQHTQFPVLTAAHYSPIQSAFMRLSASSQDVSAYFCTLPLHVLFCAKMSNIKLEVSTGTPAPFVASLILPPSSICKDYSSMPQAICATSSSIEVKHTSSL